ncbi:transposase [Streptomyces sp. NBC_01361]|nr:integrase core domain-containing protein [Streptomyces sp. NBC_01361]
MALDRRTGSLRFLLRDRDSKHTASFDTAFEADDVKILLSPPRTPKANTICERAVGTLRRELLDRTLIYNEAHAVKVLTEYTQHHNRLRPHQSRQQLPPDSAESPAPATVTDLQAAAMRGGGRRAERRRQMPPGTAPGQRVHHCREHGPLVTQSGPTTLRTSSERRQQRGDQLPEFIRNQTLRWISTHDRHHAARTSRNVRQPLGFL